MADFTDSLEKILLGAPRGIMLSPEDRERTAYHESGHALVGMLTPEADPVRKVSIIPRGMALGVTLSTPDADRVSYSREELEAKIKVALGGRVAEEVVYGKITTGAESDIQQLTQIARQMVGRWGMSDEARADRRCCRRTGPGRSCRAPARPRRRPSGCRPGGAADGRGRARRGDRSCSRATAASSTALPHALLAAETLDAPAAYAAAGVPMPAPPRARAGAGARARAGARPSRRRPEPASPGGVDVSPADPCCSCSKKILGNSGFA